MLSQCTSHLVYHCQNPVTAELLSVNNSSQPGTISTTHPSSQSCKNSTCTPASYVKVNTSSSPSSTAAVSYPSLRYHVPPLVAIKKSLILKKKWMKQMSNRKYYRQQPVVCLITAARDVLLLWGIPQVYLHPLLHQTSTMHTHCLAFHA